jgi:DNA-binding transcriptional MocR family regulator
MALWIRCHGPKGETWLTEARKLGVEFQLGKHLSVRPVADEFVRLGFAAVTPQEMNSAVDRLVTAWRRAERQ